jgi:iron complex outermembrane receptor protein
MFRRVSAVYALSCAAFIAATPAPAADVILDPVVVTATRTEERSFDLPASVDTIDAGTIEDGRPMVNLSETLPRVPGVVARNRQNYAQDLQISVRGFGARAAFGVRGVRLYQDDIPQTMPDGQGQTGSFQLLSTSRIEVLRGPFSTLYGNASGGVISVFTESGTEQPEVALNAGAGSYDTHTLGAKWTGTSRAVGYVLAGSRFDTEGYRDHSAARRDLGAAKIAFALAPRTTVTVLGTYQGQPESQDPLGLTWAQWLADPRQADPVAVLFDTRKSIRQSQGGIRVEHAFDDATTLRVTGYYGQRDVRQYLAFSGAAPTSSGGVVDLDREYGGASLKIFHRAHLGDRPVRFAAGVDWDTMDERRTGYVNNNGVAGDLRRDEDDTVRNVDAYAQAEFDVIDAVTLTAGVRASQVRFRVDDHFITAANPDDSGSVRYDETTPVVALLWRAAPTLNLYATWGEGFETPTFAELAYRPVGPGLNFDLLPATSRAFEVGAKAILADRHRLNLAAFRIDTDDEIVVNAATGGRTTYKNAGATKRRGVELAHDGEWVPGLTTHAAVTWLDAEFASDIATGQPPAIVAAGNKLPGVPAWTAYGEIVWVPTGLPWLEAAAEIQYVGKVYVNDRNVESAPAYTIGSVRVGATQRLGAWTLRGFVRSDNVTDRDYIGAVIVGDTNGRYYEPAPGRTWFAGASAHVSF